MKNLEAQVQQFGSMVNDLQVRVDQLELGSNRNHEAIMAVDRKLHGAVAQIQEDVGIQIKEQLQGFMEMLLDRTRYISLPTFLLGRDWIKFYRSKGVNQRATETSKVGEDQGEPERHQGCKLHMVYPCRDWEFHCSMM